MNEFDRVIDIFQNMPKSKRDKVFDFDPDKGMRLLYDDQDVKNFNWNQSKLKGFVSVVLFGDGRC